MYLLPKLSPSNMEKNPQLELARNFVLFTDKNIFLTGKAGTGKTTFLQNLKNDCPKRMAIIAPTGVAAINAGGVTIHSLFQMPFGPYLAESVAGGAADNPSRNRKFNRDKIKLIQSLDLLVIDEISMVRADLLDGIDEVLRRYKNRSKPFGGVQLLMIGDLHQLSPVVRDDDWRILRPYYSNLYFFGSKALQQALPVCIELKHIYRQTDTYFIDILNKVRENKIDQEVLNQLNERYIPNFDPDKNEGYITLTTHNNTAQEINHSHLKDLKGKSYFFKASISGEFPEYSYPTEPELELKHEAQVMFVKNDREKRFYNGKIGKITKIDQERIFVKCPGDTEEIEVQATEWENLKYELNEESKEVEEKTIGKFSQMPVKLAWAITIHKSQGLTFERAVIDAASSFAHGQVYVALSRCKTFEGMVLRSPIYLNSVKTDGTISTFTKEAEENTPNESQLNEAKSNFQQSMLFELFDFKAIKGRLFYCNKLCQEHSNIVPEASIQGIEEIKTEADNEIYPISETFQRQITSLLNENDLPEENVHLQERVKKASKYFFEKSQIIFFNKLKQLSFDTDNKAVNKTLKEASDNLKKEIVSKLATLNNALGGFNTIAYIKAKANAEIDFQPSTKTAETVIKAKSPVKGVSNFDLYEMLKRWRDAQAEERNVPVYIILPSKCLLDITNNLPSNSAQLEKIKGIGKQKVKQFGKEILQIIDAYCKSKNIERDTTEVIFEEPKAKPDTKKLSLELFMAGASIEDIAKQRGLSTGTIEGHLTHFITTGDLDIYRLIKKEKVLSVSEFIQSNKPLSLTEIKNAMGDDYSFGEIRAILKYLEGSSAISI